MVGGGSRRDRKRRKGLDFHRHFVGTKELGTVSSTVENHGRALVNTAS